MNYIVQIFTGGWRKPNYTPDAIMRRLEEVQAMVSVEKVIIGWNTDRLLYEAIGPWLHERGIKMLLWLPVFSEIGELMPADPAQDIFQRPIGNFSLQEGENFEFYCPTSERNIQNVLDVYDTQFAGRPFDGVFLDKIRTQSFAAGTNAVLSCGCDSCCKEYENRGFNLLAFRDAYACQGDHLFDVASLDPAQGITFRNPQTQAFFQTKCAVVADSVQAICRQFKARGLEVDLDLYAPLMSALVGQDACLIAKEADFIKPMLYRKTEAPAGIGFEYSLMQASLPDADGLPDITFDEAFLRAQLAALNDVPCKVYPGLEVNYREDIARTDPDYISSSLAVFRACGADGAVLSWDVMLAPDAHLAAVGDASCYSS